MGKAALPLVLCPTCSLPVPYGWWIRAAQKVNFGDEEITLPEEEYVVILRGVHDSPSVPDGQPQCECPDSPEVTAFLVEQIREKNHAGQNHN